MTWVHYLLFAAALGLAIIWPLSFFGYRFYRDLTQTGDHGKH